MLLTWLHVFPLLSSSKYKLPSFPVTWLQCRIAARKWICLEMQKPFWHSFCLTSSDLMVQVSRWSHKDCAAFLTSNVKRSWSLLTTGPPCEIHDNSTCAYVAKTSFFIFSPCSQHVGDTKIKKDILIFNLIFTIINLVLLVESLVLDEHMFCHTCRGPCHKGCTWDNRNGKLCCRFLTICLCFVTATQVKYASCTALFARRFLWTPFKKVLQRSTSHLPAFLENFSSTSHHC